MSTTINEVISFRLPIELKEKLEKLVKITKRSKADLLLHWVEDGIAIEEWQLDEIKAGIDEANAGKWASNEDVSKVLNKWL